MIFFGKTPNKSFLKSFSVLTIATISEALPSFSWILKKSQEINSKKRFLFGEFLVQKCFTPSELNNYIIENINEYYEFIRHTIDSVETQTINVEVNAGLEYHDRPFNAMVVITVENAITRESYDYKLAYLYIKDDWV